MAEHDFTSFPFSQFLKEFPRGVFENNLSGGPLSQSQQQLLRPRFQDFGDQFRGVLAGQANQGVLPTMNFQDFLQGLDPFQEFFKRFNSPQSRNPFNTRGAFTRFNF